MASLCLTFSAISLKRASLPPLISAECGRPPDLRLEEARGELGMRSHQHLRRAILSATKAMVSGSQSLSDSKVVNAYEGRMELALSPSPIPRLRKLH